MKRHTNHSEEWGDFVDVKRCDSPIDISRLRGKRVMLSSVTDPYNPYEKKFGVTRKILEQLAYAECDVGITTKSYLVVRDIDLFLKMRGVRVAISINSTDDGFRAQAEPYASSVGKKIEAMRRLHDAGIRTVLFIAPIFPILSDVIGIMEALRDCADEFWFDRLNLRGPNRRRVFDFIRKTRPECLALYRTIYELGDADYWRELAGTIGGYLGGGAVDL
jgi:DNA repair photolyase